MIRSFRNAETRRFFETGESRQFQGIARVAARKLDQLMLAKNLQDLRAPPANRLEPLKVDRRGQHSIRINDQYRVCFCWQEDGAHDVEIVDYH